LSEDKQEKRPMDGVWLVNRWVEVGGTKVSQPGGYCEDQADAKRLAHEINAGLASMSSHPEARRLLKMFGITEAGTNVRFVPRHSPVAVGPVGGGIIVGKS